VGGVFGGSMKGDFRFGWVGRVVGVGVFFFWEVGGRESGGFCGFFGGDVSFLWGGRDGLGADRFFLGFFLFNFGGCGVLEKREYCFF